MGPMTATPRPPAGGEGDPGAGPAAPRPSSAVVTAVIPPGDLDAVLDALDRRGAGAVHVSEAQGRPAPGAQPTETYKGAVYRVRLAARMRLEIVVPAVEAPALMDAISAAAHEPLGDGDLFAVDLLARRGLGDLDKAGGGAADAGSNAGDAAPRP